MKLVDCYIFNTYSTFICQVTSSLGHETVKRQVHLRFSSRDVTGAI